MPRTEPLAADTIHTLYEGLEDFQKKDVAELIRCFKNEDARGLAQMIAEDAYDDHPIEKVVDRGHRDGKPAVELTFDGWTAFFVGKSHKDVKVGDTLRIYGRGIGFARHGWGLNGEVVEWETPYERFAQRIAMHAEHDRGHRAHYDEAKDELAAWREELFGEFKARIDRFVAADPTFLVHQGSYETYPVVMAQRIHEWVTEDGTDRSIGDFKALEHEDQSKIIHAGKPDKYGISGWQFEAAVGMAGAVLDGGTI